MMEPSTRLENHKSAKLFFQAGAGVCIVMGIGVLIYFIHKVSESHSIPEKGEILNFAHFGAFGDFVAGVVGTVFTLAGFFLLYLTLREQRESFYRERFESRYYELIKFHRDNVNELHYSYFETRNDKVTAEKRKVFKIIFVQFKEAWLELDHFFHCTEEELFDSKYLEQLRSSKTIMRRKIDLLQLARIDIIYLIVYFGLSKDDRRTILRMCEKRYNRILVEKILDFCSLKPQRESDFWMRWESLRELPNGNELLNEILTKRRNPAMDRESVRYVFRVDMNAYQKVKTFYIDNYFKYYGGHQFRLGHYFRNLYQAVTLVHEDDLLTDDEKYEYIRILRSQLSTYEQVLLFLNSVSILGMKWELNCPKPNFKKAEEDNHIISKYNFIRNAPIEHIDGQIKINEYYPNINFEGSSG